MNASYDAIVIGGGAAGLLSALQLADAGGGVCVVEKGEVGRESSWAGGGILSPLYPWRYPAAVSRLWQWSTTHFPALFERLECETGIDPEWLECGHLILDASEEQAAAQDWASGYDTPLQIADTGMLQDIEPALARHFDNAIWLPKIGQVRNPRLMQGLQQLAIQQGIEILTHCEVSAIHHDNRQLRSVQTSQGEIQTPRALLAAGAWSGSIFQDLALPPVQPVMGQMIQYQTNPGTVQRIVMFRDHYVIPRRDGRVLVGSTLEDTGFEKPTTEAARTALQQAACELFPILESAEIVAHWAGLRPGNERQTPFIGEHPAIAGLFINTGHFRNGITTGLASARLAADLMLGRAPTLPPEDYQFVIKQAVADKIHCRS